MKYCPIWHIVGVIHNKGWSSYMYTHKKHKECFSTLVMHTECYQQGITVSMSFLQNLLVQCKEWLCIVFFCYSAGKLFQYYIFFFWCVSPFNLPFSTALFSKFQSVGLRSCWVFLYVQYGLSISVTANNPENKTIKWRSPRFSIIEFQLKIHTHHMW